MWANFAQRPPWQEDHLPKKTTFGPVQKWSPYQGSTVFDLLLQNAEQRVEDVVIRSSVK